MVMQLKINKKNSSHFKDIVQVRVASDSITGVTIGKQGTRLLTARTNQRPAWLTY